jgi:AraC-like DNA-binding protein
MSSPTASLSLTVRSGHRPGSRPVSTSLSRSSLRIPGEGIAKRTAQQLVVYYRRPGGQSQFSALLEADRPAGRFSPVLAWARGRLGERLSVDRLADRAAMSPRHFAGASLPKPA